MGPLILKTLSLISIRLNERRGYHGIGTRRQPAQAADRRLPVQHFIMSDWGAHKASSTSDLDLDLENRILMISAFAHLEDYHSELACPVMAMSLRPQRPTGQLSIRHLLPRQYSSRFRTHQFSHPQGLQSTGMLCSRFNASRRTSSLAKGGYVSSTFSLQPILMTFGDTDTS
jgi:hypothetical protein